MTWAPEGSTVGSGEDRKKHGGKLEKEREREC